MIPCGALEAHHGGSSVHNTRGRRAPRGAAARRLLKADAAGRPTPPELTARHLPYPGRWPCELGPPEAFSDEPGPPDFGRSGHVEHLPLEDDKSHAGLFGYTADDLAVAAELRTLILIQLEHVHPAVSGP